MRNFVILSLILLTACQQSKQKNELDFPKTHYYQTDKDTSRHAIIKYDITRDSSLLSKNVKPTILTEADIIKIEYLIKNQAALYNKTHTIKPIIQPEKYYKKIIPCVNIKGEKIVWVDCFCQVIGNNWKTTSQIVSDGGSCYLHLKINLTTNKVIGFSTNGIA